jgi:hypothetical protein
MRTPPYPDAPILHATSRGGNGRALPACTVRLRNTEVDPTLALTAPHHSRMAPVVLAEPSTSGLGLNSPLICAGTRDRHIRK